MCNREGLPSLGRKVELIQRLVDHHNEGEEDDETSSIHSENIDDDDEGGLEEEFIELGGEEGKEGWCHENDEIIFRDQPLMSESPSIPIDDFAHHEEMVSPQISPSRKTSDFIDMTENHDEKENSNSSNSSSSSSSLFTSTTPIKFMEESLTPQPFLSPSSLALSPNSFIPIQERESEGVVEEKDVVVLSEENSITTSSSSSSSSSYPKWVEGRDSNEVDEGLLEVVEGCEHLQWVECPTPAGIKLRIRCTLTHHEMPPRLDQVINHLGSKKTRRAMEQEEVRTLCKMHGLVEHPKYPGKIHCPLTGAIFKRCLKQVRRHINGKAYRDLAVSPSLSPRSCSLSYLSSSSRDLVDYKLKGVASPEGVHMAFNSPPHQPSSTYSSSSSSSSSPSSSYVMDVVTWYPEAV